MAVTKTTKEKLFVPFSVLTFAVFVSQNVMEEEGHTSLVRPLLVLNRYQTKKLCQLWEMPVYPDQTNEKLVFARNRVRNQLLPILRSFFNPQVDAVLSHLSEALLVEWFHGEFLLVKLGRNAKDWNLLQAIYQTLHFCQTKAVVQQHGASAYLPHVRNVLRCDMVVELNTTQALLHFPRHQNTTLDDQQVAQSTRFERLRVSCAPNSANQQLRKQFPRLFVEWSVKGHIQVKRSLAASIKKRCCKPLFTKGVSWLSKTQLGQSSTLGRKTGRTLRERTPLSDCLQENVIEDRLSCQLVGSPLHAHSLRYHYLYFPKFGCFVALGTTLYPKNRI